MLPIREMPLEWPGPRPGWKEAPTAQKSQPPAPGWPGHGLWAQGPAPFAFCLGPRTDSAASRPGPLRPVTWPEPQGGWQSWAKSPCSRGRAGAVCLWVGVLAVRPPLESRLSLSSAAPVSPRCPGSPCARWWLCPEFALTHCS